MTHRYMLPNHRAPKLPDTRRSDHMPRKVQAAASVAHGPVFELERVRLYQGDCLSWLANCPEQSIHAVLTDPPFTPVEYPFAGSGSTLAACQALGNEGIGVEVDPKYIEVACSAISQLAALPVRDVHAA